MDIALTTKMAKAMGQRPPANDEECPALFSWTASCFKAYCDSQEEDLLVLVNGATRFTVVLQGFKQRDPDHWLQEIEEAITKTLLAMDYNPEMVRAYMDQAGKLNITRNSSRTRTAWVNEKAGDISTYLWHHLKRSKDPVRVALARSLNQGYYKWMSWKANDTFPEKDMAEALARLTGLPIYKSDAFEFLVVLDLGSYEAWRRILVPTHLDFYDLHKVLQRVFDWKDEHIYAFSFGGRPGHRPDFCLVPKEEHRTGWVEERWMKGLTLSEFFPNYPYMLYTYDFGDHWEHELFYQGLHKGYEGRLPYLLEGSGAAPPEDVGGIGGFLRFKEIFLDPHHPDHEEVSEWAGDWSPEDNISPRRIDL